MKHLAAAIVCLAVLYALDAIAFDGWYFGVAGQAVAKAYALHW